MPGVYEKKMQGDRYDLIVDLVESSHKMIAAESYEMFFVGPLPSLLALVSERSKDAVEEFVYAKGFNLFFEVLHKGASVSSDYCNKQRTFLYESVNRVLKFLSSLLSVEYDPFDENLGLMPVLIYFLSERHTYTVDIAWKSDELTLMAAFLKSYFALLKVYPFLEGHETTSLQLIVITLSDVLSLFPPQRVVASAMKELNDPSLYKEFFPALKEATKAWKNGSEGIYIIVKLLYHISIFGIGCVIVEKMPESVLLLNLYSQFLPEMRCSCSLCELHRRLQRAIRDRDEFGLATEEKQQVCRILVKNGLIPFLCEIFEFTNTSSPQEFVGVKSCDNTPSTTVADDNCGPNETIDFNDHTREVAARIVWLCSWAAEETHRCSILSANNFILLASMLQSFSFSDRRNWFNLDSMEIAPGVSSVLECICAVLFRISSFEERHNVWSRMRSTVETMLETLCGLIKEACLSQTMSECVTWRRQGCKVVLVQTSLLAACIVGSHASSSLKLRSRKRLQLPLKQSCFEACASACETEVDTFKKLGFAPNPQLFIPLVLLSMGFLVGGYEYSHSSELARDFLPHADPGCGFMVSAAQSLLARAPAECCCLVLKRIRSIVVSRVERALALSIS